MSIQQQRQRTDLNFGEVPEPRGQAAPAAPTADDATLTALSDAFGQLAVPVNVVLGSNFTTTNATPQTTPLAFTPAANSTYLIEAVLMIRTSVAADGVKVGFALPTGLNDNTMHIDVATTAAAIVQGNSDGVQTVTGTQLPNATGSFPARVWGIIVTGASPSGNFEIKIGTETGGTTATCRAGSTLSYRKVA